MSTAEGPALAAAGGDQKPESATPAPAAPKKGRIALSKAYRLANLASGAATTFLIGGVAAVVLGVCALATAQVLYKPAKPGHDAFSSEKPQALRKETPRTLEEEKAKLAKG